MNKFSLMFLSCFVSVTCATAASAQNTTSTLGLSIGSSLSGARDAIRSDGAPASAGAINVARTDDTAPAASLAAAMGNTKPAGTDSVASARLGAATGSAPTNPFAGALAPVSAANVMKTPGEATAAAPADPKAVAAIGMPSGNLLGLVGGDRGQIATQRLGN